MFPAKIVGLKKPIFYIMFQYFCTKSMTLDSEKQRKSRQTRVSWKEPCHLPSKLFPPLWLAETASACPALHNIHPHCL